MLSSASVTPRASAPAAAGAFFALSGFHADQNDDKREHRRHEQNGREIRRQPCKHGIISFFELTAFSLSYIVLYHVARRLQEGSGPFHRSAPDPALPPARARKRDAQEREPRPPRGFWPQDRIPARNNTFPFLFDDLSASGVFSAQANSLPPQRTISPLRSVSGTLMIRWFRLPLKRRFRSFSASTNSPSTRISR